MSRILVACVGNIFRSDDGFGVEVADRLAGVEVPPGTTVEDYGIRSVHLTYELMEGYDLLVLVDTVSQQAGPPGSLYLIEPDLEGLSGPGGEDLPRGPVDAHDLPPGSVLGLLPDLGAQVGKVLVVGCRPETLDDGIGLSPPVAGAVDAAAAMVLDVVRRESARLASRQPAETTEEDSDAQEADDAGVAGRGGGRVAGRAARPEALPGDAQHVSSRG